MDDDIVLLSTASSESSESNGTQQAAFLYHAAAGQMKRPGSLFMYMAVIQPGENIPPHAHPEGTETIVYLLSGNVEHLYGRRLHKSMLNHAGDFVYIPGGVMHQPINLSSSEPVRAIVACNCDLSIESNSIPYSNEAEMER